MTFTTSATQDRAEALAGEPIECRTGMVYGQDQAGVVYQIDLATGAATPYAQKQPAGVVNALGVSADLTQFLMVDDPATTGAVSIYEVDAATNATQAVPSGVNQADVNRGAVNPVNGLYYWSYNTNGQVPIVRVYDPATNIASTTPAFRVADNSGFTGTSGDIVFDDAGTMYMVVGSQSSTDNRSAIYRINGTIPTTGANVTLSRTLVSIIPQNGLAGITFDGDGYLYAQGGSNLYKVDPATGAIISTTTIRRNGAVFTGILDLADCEFNPTIQLNKDVQERIGATDQFALTISGGGYVGGGAANSGLTTGTDTGLQTATGEVAGPVPAREGITYTLTETTSPGSLASYATSLACTDAGNGGASVAATRVSQGVYTVTVPDGANAPHLQCTFANGRRSTPDPGFPCLTPTVFNANSSITVLQQQVQDNTGGSSFIDVGVTNPGWRYNSIAFNPADNLIYAVSQSSPVSTSLYPASHLLAIGPDGIVDRGAITGLPAATGLDLGAYNLGAFDEDGNYWVGASGQSFEAGSASGRLYRVNLGTRAATPLANQSAPINAADVTWGGGFLWGITSSSARPVRVNLATGAVTLFPPQSFLNASTGDAGAYGAAWTYSNGNLGFDSNAGGLVQVRVTNPASASPTFELVAAASGPASTFNDGTACGQPADLAIEKLGSSAIDPDGATVAPGGTVDFTLRVSNVGSTNSSGYVVTDDLPIGYTSVTTSQAGCTVTGSASAGFRVSCVLGVLDAGAHFDIPIRAVFPASGCLTNSATVLGNEQDPNPSNNTDDLRTCVQTNPAIDVTKTANRTTFNQAGDLITYTFVARNTGDTTLTDVRVTDPLPGLSALSCSPATPATLAPGAATTCTATYTVKQSDVDAGKVDNTATATGTPPGGTPVTDTDTETVNGAAAGAIQVVKTANRTAFDQAGDVITYTFVATNTGNVTLTNVRVTDPLPGLSALSCSPATPTTLLPGASTTCTATYTVKQSDVDAGKVDNTATATGTPPSGTPVTDTDTETVGGSPDASIDLVKSASPSSFSRAGDVITYTFIARNTGNVTLSNVRVADPLPGLSSLSCSPATPATLAPGAATTCTATYTIKQSDVNAGRVTNVATATGTPPTGSPVTDDDTKTVDGAAAPSIALVKSASPGSFSKPGDIITYSFTTTNTGNVSLSGVRITDPLPGLSALACSPAAPATLAPGASMSCAATYAVTQDDLDRGSITNVATSKGTPPTGDDVTAEDTKTVTGGGSSGISLIKSVEPTTVARAGELLTYTFLATNTGSMTLSNVEVTDPLPGLSALTCSPAAPATLLPGASMSCSAQYRATQADIDAGKVTNTAVAAGVPPTGDPVTDTDTKDVPITATPAVDLVKTANKATFTTAGEVITYTFVATNSGNVNLHDVTITDPLPGLSALTCNPARPAQLAPNARMTCTATYTVTQADVDAGQIVNAATATGTSPTGTDVSDDDTKTVPGGQASSIDLVKTASPTTFSRAGETITYTFTATNTGNVTLRNVDVDDPLPGLSPLSCTPGTPATLAPGATVSCTATYTTTQADVSAGKVVNAATAEGTDPGGSTVSDDDTKTVTAAPSPDIDLVKSASPTVFTAAGTPITYRFVATNTGNTTLTGVKVDDPLPGLSALSCTPSAPATLVPGAALICTGTYTTTQADVDAGRVDNTATATGTPPTGPAVTDTDTKTVTGAAAPAIDVVKTSPTTTFTKAGDTIDYSFVGTNTGAVTLRNVTIADPLAGLSPLSCTPSLPATLAPGAKVNCTATYQVTQADVDAGKVLNSATVTGTPPTGPSVIDTDDHQVDGSTDPSIDLVKTANKTSFSKAGETITYRLVATNTGNTTLSGVEVDDPMAGLSTLSCAPQVPATLAPGAKVTCTATYVTTQADVDAGAIANAAAATGTPPTGPPVDDEDEHTVPGSSAPSIDLQKSADKTSFAKAGETITYTLVATNTGNTTLTGVEVDDPMAGLSTLSCSPTIPATLAPGAKATCTATYKTTQADVDAGEVANAATATGTPPTGPPVEDEDEHTVPGAGAPAIELVKTADRSSYTSVGQVITYKFVTTNTGAVTLSGVRVGDPLPGLSPLVCAPAAPASLRPGQTMTCTATYAVTQADIDAGQVHNAATATGTPPTGPPVGTGDEHTVPAGSTPSIDLQKTTDKTSFAAAGETITYRLVATNTGNITLRNVSIDDPMAGLSSLSCSPAIPATLAPGARVTCTATYKTTQADVDAGEVANAAAATGTPPTGPPVDDEDEHTVPGDPDPSLDLVKTANKTSFTEAGETITYRLVATNTGNTTLRNVTIDDPMAGLSSLSCSPAIPATLAPGAKVTCTATYVTTQADVDAGKVANAAAATGTPPTGPPTTDEEEHTVPGSSDPSLDLVKTADKTRFSAAGEIITYRLVATNTGNTTLRNVTVDDPMAGLSSLTCAPAIPATLAPGAKVTCTATYRTTQADVDAGEVANAATATGTPPTGPPTTDEDEHTVPGSSAPSIDLQKTADKTEFTKAGETITYRLVATNTGNTTLTGVEVDDPMAGLSSLSCSPQIPATLAPGAKVTCTATYKTTQADVDAGKVANAATSTGTPPTGTPVEDEDEHTVPGQGAPALDLVKSSNRTSYSAVGQVITYRFLATNTGAVTLTGVRIADPLPGLSALTCAPAAPATLVPGQSMSCTATYAVTQADLDDGTVHNAATAAGTPPTGPPIGTTDEHDVPAASSPGLDLQKSTDKATFSQVGETITYRLVATNTGNTTLRNVTIDDPMQGLSALSCAPQIPATLAPGAKVTCTATYVTRQADVDAGKVANAATATGTPPTGTPVEDEDEHTVPGNPDPSLDLVKTADKTEFTKAGETITYRLVATNTGNVTLTGVRVTDPMAGLSTLSCAPQVPATLAPGAKVTCTATYVTTQADVDAGRIANAAAATGQPPTGPPTTDEEEHTIPGADGPAIDLSKTVDATTISTVGQKLTYTFVTKNTGNVTLTGVRVTDPLPGLSALSCAPSAPASLAPGATMTCTATYTVTQADVDAGKVANVATATGTPPTGDPVDSTDTETVNAPAHPNLALVKTADKTSFTSAGETITYTFVTSNTGNVTMTGVRVADPMPGLSALSCVPAAPAMLAPGATQICRATYVTTQADVTAGKVHNAATATGTPPTGPPVDVPGETEVPSEGAPSIDLVKTADKARFTKAGETITYTFVATNRGPSSLSGVRISDPLAGLSALSCTPGQPATLVPGAALRCTATYVTTQADVDNGGVHNAAAVIGTPPTGPPVDEEDEVDVPSTPAPAIQVVKTADATTLPKIGDEITYTFVATNTGNVSLSGVKVSDPLPGLSALDCDPDAPATLAPGQKMTCTATYTVKKSDVDAGKVVNNATAVGTPPTGDPVDDEDTETVTTPGTGAIEVDKTADRTVFTVGDTITYRMVATNVGGVTLRDVVITDPLRGLSALDCDPDAPATLVPGQSMTCTATYIATLEDVERDRLVNTATATGTPPTGPKVTDTDTKTLESTLVRALDLDKTADRTTYRTGDVVTYTFVATNTGNVTLDHVEIADALPGLSPLTCDPAAPSSLAPGETMTCTATYAVTPEDVERGSIANAATATASNPGFPPVHHEDQVTIHTGNDNDGGGGGGFIPGYQDIVRTGSETQRLVVLGLVLLGGGFLLVAGSRRRRQAA